MDGATRACVTNSLPPGDSHAWDLFNLQTGTKPGSVSPEPTEVFHHQEGAASSGVKGEAKQGFLNFPHQAANGL